MSANAIYAPNSSVTAQRVNLTTGKLHIGLLIHSLLPGGAERVCSLLANYWAEQGHRVSLMTFTPQSTDTFAVSSAVQRVEIGHWQLSPNRWHALRKNLARVWRVRQMIQGAAGSRLDVVVSFLPVSNTCLALAGLGTGVARIGSERTYPPAIPLGRLGEMGRWWIYGWLDAVVAQTEDAARWLREHTRTRVAVAVPNPVRLPLIDQEPRLDPAKWLRPGAKLLLAVGRLREEKGFDELIKAFAQACQTGSNKNVTWQLVLVGEGPMRKELEERVRSLGVQDHVLLPGRAGNVGDWYAAADAFALTSRFEGYPNALLEALASGVPALAVDVKTGPRELIEDGINGLLIAPNSHSALTAALARLMHDDTLRKQFAAQSQRTLQMHAIGPIAGQWEATFQSALAKRGRL
jgi:glycosyltransferase involved in cell wall biosynthesis